MVELVRAGGADVRKIYGGESYRSGGVLVVHPVGYWDQPVPVRVETAPEKAWDGTGYDGRGRRWDIIRLVPDAAGMVPVTRGQWSKLDESDRAVVGGGGSSKSEDGAVHFGRPGADRKSDISGLLAGLTITVPPVVVTRHPALVALLRERGLVSGDCRVIDHAGPDDVRGQDVIGVLPLSLAALARTVTEIPLNLTPEMRGKELDLETLRRIAGEEVKYMVTEM